MAQEKQITGPVPLPRPAEHAYFPDRTPNRALSNEVLLRAGAENLVYALEYGSHVSGDAGPTSIHDVMIIVDDAKRFHKDNLALHGADYGLPRTAQWHSFLNSFGFNFYQSHFRGEDDSIQRFKLAVISKDDFIRGCSGTLHHGDDGREGAFGMYVAGRIQKAALSPLYHREDESAAAIESAINAARIDGVWFAMGLLGKQFNYEELLRTYVSLSYRADVRVEKKGKVETLIERSREDYAAMLEPIIASFVARGLMEATREGYEKTASLSKDEIDRRLRELKAMAFATNYLKNPLTAGLGNGLYYALQKILRSIDSYRPSTGKSEKE